MKSSKPSLHGPVDPSSRAEAGAWLFGYGSLMWNPGFTFHCRHPAILSGYHRSYAMVSTRNRGTPARPGLLLSLAPGRECTGMAFHIEPERTEEAWAYLDQREGAGEAHRRVRVPIRMSQPKGDAGESNGTVNGAVIHAHVYLPILSYPNYINGVPQWRQAELVAQARGRVGTSLDYLKTLLAELDQLGVTEPALERLYRDSLVLGDDHDSPTSPLMAE